MTDIKMPQGNVELLRAAISGHIMEHGVAPDFVLMSSDVAQGIFSEVRVTSGYAGIIKTGGPNEPMRVTAFGESIEIGQIVGTNRVEMVCDLAAAKAKRSIGRA